MLVRIYKGGSQPTSAIYAEIDDHKVRSGAGKTYSFDKQDFKYHAILTPDEYNRALKHHAAKQHAPDADVAHDNDDGLYYIRW